MRKILKRLLITVGSLLTLLLLIALPPFLYFQAGCAVTTTQSEQESDKQSTLIATSEISPAKQGLAGYVRDEESTYLTFPEWYIVYSADEYAAFLKENRPSQFPYFASVGQFWRTYGCVYEVTKNHYPFNGGRHVMLVVIGTSYSGEYVVKGIYENTVGRVTEWFSGGAKTAEDEYAQHVAEEYGTFLHTIPWYEFPFGQKLKNVWQTTDLGGPQLLRKWERKIALTVEYAIKAVYGVIIEKATRATYVPAPLEINAFVKNIPPPVLAKTPGLNVMQQLGNAVQLVELPRYEAFTNVVTLLARQKIEFIEIAGNDDILITAIAPSDWSGEVESGDVLFAMPILTAPGQQRFGIRVAVSSLSEIINDLESQGIKIEHVYDY